MYNSTFTDLLTTFHIIINVIYLWRFINLFTYCIVTDSKSFARAGTYYNLHATATKKYCIAVFINNLYRIIQNEVETISLGPAVAAVNKHGT